MLSHFRKIVASLLFAKLLATGTQFLSVPASAYDLIFFQTAWRNPASLNYLDRSPELGLAYGNWLAGIESFSFNWKGQLRRVSGALDIRYLGMDDIELRPNKPTSEPLGYYAAYGLSTRGVFSIDKGNIQLGLGLQMINFQIYQESSYGTAVDLGLGWDISEKFKLSISALNLGSMNSIISESPDLPKRVMGSLSYNPDSYSVFSGIESNHLVSDLILYAGMNSRYKNLIFGGTIMSNKDVRSLSGGIGIDFGIYSVRYGFQWGNQHLGMPQIIDISVRLP